MTTQERPYTSNSSGGPSGTQYQTFPEFSIFSVMFLASITFWHSNFGMGRMYGYSSFVGTPSSR